MRPYCPEKIALSCPRGRDPDVYRQPRLRAATIRATASAQAKTAISQFTRTHRRPQDATRCHSIIAGGGQCSDWHTHPQTPGYGGPTAGSAGQGQHLAALPNQAQSHPASHCVTRLFAVRAVPANRFLPNSRGSMRNLDTSARLCQCSRGLQRECPLTSTSPSTIMFNALNILIDK